MANIVTTKRDLIWSYVGNFLKLTINLLLLPIILKFLSDDELGMWYVFASIGQLVILLDFGFAPSLARNIAYVWCGAKDLSRDTISNNVVEETDAEYFKVVLMTCRYIYVSISIIAIVLLLFAGTPYILSLSPEKGFTYSWLVYSVGAFLNILYSYYSSFLLGIGCIAENNKAGVISKCVQIITCVVLLLLGLGLLGVCIAYLLSGIALRMSSRYYFIHAEGVKKFLAVKVDNLLNKCLKVFRIVSHNAIKDGLVTLSNYLSTQANTLICSSILGLSTTGSYGLAVQLSSIVSSIASIPFAVVQPSLQENALRGDINQSRKSFFTAMVGFLLSFILLSIGCLFCLPVLVYIKPSIIISIPMLVVLLINVLVYQTFHLSASYISTFNTLPYTSSFIISSMISVVLSYCLASQSDMGVWALVVSPLIVSLCYNAWKWPKYVLSKTGLSLSEAFILGINGIKERFSDMLEKYRRFK